MVDDLIRLILGGQGVKEGVGITDYGILVIDTDGTITKNDTLKVAGSAADRFEMKWSVFDAELSRILIADEMAAYHDLHRPTSDKCLKCPEMLVCGGGMPGTPLVR